MSELAPGTPVGEYVVEAKVGEGSMGEVYRAIHPYIGKRAAIKVMRSYLVSSQDAITRFTREAQTVGRLGHPNIIDAYSFGQLPDGRCYLVMEWLHGECLGDRLERGPLTLVEASGIFEQVCHALESAHACGIIHRDLKPDNIFLAQVGGDPGTGAPTRVKLLDFGIAKLVGAKQEELTRTGCLVGTPAYVSPEQARSSRLDWRTDVYSLGVVAFHAFTGRLPFEAPGMQVLGMHLSAEAPRARTLRPDLPPRLDELIAQMMEKEPTRRPMLRDVRHAFAEARRDPSAMFALGTPMPAIAAPPPPQPQQPVRVEPPTPLPQPAPPRDSYDMTIDELIASLPREAMPSEEAIESLTHAPPAPARPATRPSPPPPRPSETSVVRKVEPAPTGEPLPPTWLWAAATIGLAAAVALAVILFLWLAREPTRPVRAMVSAAVPPVPHVVELARIQPPSTGAGAIVLMVDDPTAEITLDGVAVPRAGRAMRVPVRDSGPHRVRISRRDRAPVERVVEVGPGQVVDVVVSDAAAP